MVVDQSGCIGVCLIDPTPRGLGTQWEYAFVVRGLIGERTNALVAKCAYVRSAVCAWCSVRRVLASLGGM